MRQHCLYSRTSLHTHVRLKDDSGSLRRGLVAVLWLLLSVASVSAQDLRWETATNAGVKAFDQGRYAEAAQQFKTALTLAENCMPDDPRLSTSLMNLAVAYYTQGQYAYAAPLSQRALALQEQLLGPAHPQ